MIATYVECPQETYTGHTWPGMESVCVVLIGFFLAWCISIRVTATLSVMSDSLSLQSSRSMFGVLLMVQGYGYGYGYDYIIIMIIVFTYL